MPHLLKHTSKEFEVNHAWNGVYLSNCAWVQDIWATFPYVYRVYIQDSANVLDALIKMPNFVIDVYDLYIILSVKMHFRFPKGNVTKKVCM